MAIINIETGGLSQAESNQQAMPNIIDLDTGEISNQNIVKQEQPVLNNLTKEQKKSLPQGTLADALIEPVVAVGSGILGQIGSGIAGGITTLFDDLDIGVETVSGIKQGAAEFGAPETQVGQRSLETLGELVEAGVDLANIPVSGLTSLGYLLTGQGLDESTQVIKDVQEKGFGATVGDKAFKETGDPLLSTIAQISPEIAASFFPIAKIANKKIELKQKIAEKIQSGSTDVDIVEYIINGAGKARKDPLAKNAIKQGFDQAVIQSLKGSTGKDKAKMLQMVDIMQKGKNNALYGQSNRPSQVAGDSLLDRARYVKKINREAGKEINIAANALRGEKVDFQQPINSFLENLDEMGITLDKRLRPNFKGSDIEGLKSPQQAVAKIVKRMSSGKLGESPDAYDLHRMKRYIDEVVTYGKSGEGLAGKTERIMKQLRADIDGTLDTNFPEYNKANIRYSDTVSALDSLQSVAGKKVDLFGQNADKAVGTLLRRLMSNDKSRVNLVDAVDELNTISKKHGGQFNDDVNVQMLFADELDKMFGSVAKTSLAGEVGKGVKKGAEMATGQRTIVGTLTDLGAAGIEKARGINEQNAFKSIRELLERQ